jgi:uncharacterized protein (DUF302 family)
MFWQGSFPRDTNWDFFLIRVIEIFREKYETENTKVKEVIKDKLFDVSLLSPCQIEVLDSGREVVWLVVHDSNLQDMKFGIHESVKSYGESVFARKYDFKSLPSNFLESKPSTHDNFFIFTKQKSIDSLPGLPEEVAANFFEQLRSLAGHELKGDQVAVIKSSTRGLRQSISKLPQEDRDNVEKIPERIDKALEEIKRIDEHEKKLSSIEKDISGMRHLVGVSKEYQDWRILTSDVESLKKRPYVSKELFESEVKRLDQRVDAMKEIKFWSKRTIIDVILAIVATASTIIAALFAAGVIHF